MTIHKKSFIGAIIVVILAGVAVGYLTSTSATPASQEVLHAAYPLYAQGISWQDEAPLSVPPHLATNPTDQTIVGSVVTSLPSATTTDISSIAEPFRNFYDQLLVANGWTITPKYQADGPGSSVWGYTKGNDVLIFNYQSNFLNNQPGQPVQCPCTIQFSILGGVLQ